jgi:hypothetical protein
MRESEQESAVSVINEMFDILNDICTEQINQEVDHV